MRTWLAVGLGWVTATAAFGALSTQRVEQDLAAATTASLNSNVWGLVCPEVPVTVFEVRDLAGRDRDLVTMAPSRAEFSDGALSFQLGESAAVFGVGNCDNRLPAGRRPLLPDRFDLKIDVEQSVPGTVVWTMIPWHGGERVRMGSLIARRTSAARSKKMDVEEYLQSHLWRYCRVETEGAGRHTITLEDTGEVFRRTGKAAAYDGLEFEVKGPAGAAIKVHGVNVSRKVRRGGFRKELTLPPGRIWRAVASINRKTLLSINGKEVPSSNLLKIRPHPNYMYGQQLQEVDLQPFLKAGRNVLAAWPAFNNDANAFLHATIVMESGEVITGHTDPSWRYVPDRKDGWDTPGADVESRAVTNEMPFTCSSLPAELTAVRYGYRLYMQMTHSQPAYAGRVLLQAPDDNQLYFSAAGPFSMLAKVPAGLAAQEPSVEWVVCRYRPGAALENVLSGMTAEFTRRDGSLEFRLEQGTAGLPMGVYVVKAVLRGAGGEVLEDRIPEPMMVTARIPMGRTEGRTFEDGLELEQEARIDFTKPDDPAFPWMEIDGDKLCEEPIVVTRNGMTYRETRAGASDHTSQVLITYNYAFEHPGDFYVMTLEYPDDNRRFFGVNLCSEHDGRSDHSKAGPAVWTGIWHLNTGKMQELTWLFRPDPGYTSINLINMMPGVPAAASVLRISHVKSILPELATRGSARRFGILTESARSFSGFGKTFRSSSNPQTASQILYRMGGAWEENARKVSPVKVRLDAFAEWLDTCRHYVEYQRWAGQNLIFLSYFQYDGFVPNAEPSSVAGDHRLAPHITDIAARVFRDNGVDFFSSIEYASDPILHEKYRETRNPDNSPYLVNSEGEECRIWKTGYNFNHPEVRASMFRVAAGAVRKFRDLPNFRGVNFTTSFSSCMMGPNYFNADDGHRPLEPLRFGYSDATVGKFEKETGIKLPVPADSPARFSMRHKLLTSDKMREQWIEWRAENMVNFFLEIRDELRKIKPDVKVTTGVISAGYFFDYAVNSGKSTELSMREFGWDFPKFHGHEGLYTMPWLQGSGRYGFAFRDTMYKARYEEYLRRLKANDSAAHIKIGDGEIERMAMVDYGWLELERGAQATLPQRDHWQVPYQYTMEAAARGDNALRPFLRAMAAIDADSMLYGFTDTNLKIGNEQPLREFARFMRSLPKQKFARVPGGRDLVVRALPQDGKLLFYALNPAPWPVQATIALENAGKVTNLISGESSDAPARALIPPYHGVSFEATGEAKVSGWETRGTGEMFPLYTRHMKQTLDTVEHRLLDRKIGSVLLPDEKSAMRRLLAGMKEAEADERYAELWQLQRAWDFNWHAYFLERQHRAVGLITEDDPPPAEHGKKTLQAVRIDTAPVIDGAVDDAVWQSIEPEGAFVDKDGKPSGVGTEIRVAWDSTHLYIAFVCRDRIPGDIVADAVRESQVMRDDCVVFLLQPNLETSRHYQLAFNTTGVKFDQQDFDYSFAPDWQAVARVTDEGWTAEVAFPFSALETKPETGTRWGANFCRIFRKNLLPWSTWSYMPRNWHDPAGYGVIEFK